MHDCARAYVRGACPLARPARIHVSTAAPIISRACPDPTARRPAGRPTVEISCVATTVSACVCVELAVVGWGGKASKLANKAGGVS
jgi:hypothetical protein